MENVFKTGVSKIAILAVLAVPLAGVAYDLSAPNHGAAFAQEESGSGGNQEQTQTRTGGEGGHEDDTSHEESSHDGGSGGQGGAGGHEDSGETSEEEGPDSSDGQGPQANKPEDGTQGGMPVWAGMGIPEVELGRLSVVRSPQHVIDLALAEALQALAADPSIGDFYDQDLATIVGQLEDPLVFETLTYIDSPLQNLALMQVALLDYIDGSTSPTDADELEKLMAVYLGTASDKTIEISDNTAIAVVTILLKDEELTEAQITLINSMLADLADNAEDVREAIEIGHG